VMRRSPTACEFGATRLVSDKRGADAASAIVPELAAGDRFRIGREIFSVQGTRKRDGAAGPDGGLLLYWPDPHADVTG